MLIQLHKAYKHVEKFQVLAPQLKNPTTQQAQKHWIKKQQLLVFQKFSILLEGDEVKKFSNLIYYMLQRISAEVTAEVVTFALYDFTLG